MKNQILPSAEEILSLLSEIELIGATLLRELAEVENEDLLDHVRAFITLKQVKESSEVAFKAINAAFEDTKVVKLPARFDTAQVPTVHLKEGYRVTVSQNVRASVRGGKKEEAYQWLRENGLEDIVTETVNSSTLSALAKNMAEDNLELNSDFFNVAIVPNTSVTRTK